MFYGGCRIKDKKIIGAAVFFAILEMKILLLFILENRHTLTTLLLRKGSLFKSIGTTFNQYGDYNKEPYQNFLARNLSPSINFSFEEAVIDDKRVVVLVIPAAEEIPTAFKE